MDLANAETTQDGPEKKEAGGKSRQLKEVFTAESYFQIFSRSLRESGSLS